MLYRCFFFFLIALIREKKNVYYINKSNGFVQYCPSITITNVTPKYNENCIYYLK